MAEDPLTFVPSIQPRSDLFSFDLVTEARKLSLPL